MYKMKKIIATTAVLASSVAFAGDYKMNLEGRFDFVNAKLTSGTTSEKYNSFSNSVIRLNMLSQINDQLSFRFRYRFVKSGANPVVNSTFGTADSNREYSGTQLDYLYVDHKNSIFTTRFGKQNWTEAMGRELFVAATDVFVKSQAYSDYQSAFGSDYRAGVSAIFKMDSNTLTLAVSNPNTLLLDSSTGASANNSGFALGAHYNGSFMNKLVQPVLSYQTTKLNGDTDNTTKTKDGNATAMALGLRSEVSGFTIDADFKQVKIDNRNSTGITDADAGKTTSIMANIAYTMNEFTPFVSYVSDKANATISAPASSASTPSTSTVYAKTDDTKAYKKSTYGLGLMYKPIADVNFRYHLAYTSAKKEKDGSTSGASEFEDKRIIFGIKADI